MKVLVAGANGFIGMNLTLYLLSQGHEVVMSFRDELTNEGKHALEKYNKVHFCKGDLLDPKAMEELASYDFDAIINGAIMTSIGDDELSYFIPMCNTNLRTNINLMEFALRKKIKRYLYISSSGVYGSYSSPGEFVYEDSTLDLFSTYCITKYASELLTEKMGELSGMETLSVRIAAPYGPFERVTDGRTAMSVVYKVAHMAISGEEAVIYGKDVVRDWTYVGDTVRGIAGLLTAEQLHYSVYNVSSSVDVTLGEIAEAVEKASGTLKYRFTDNPSEANVLMVPEQQRGALSTKRLSEDTEYQPADDINSGVEKYYRYLKEGDFHV